MTRYDIAIIGAGIAGASIAAEVAPHASVLVLEAEDQPGYHSTGRSAAYWSETYGGPTIQPLTTASGPVLEAGGFLSPLGALHIGRAGDEAKRDAFVQRYAESGVEISEVDPQSMMDGLRPEWTIGLFEPSSAAIDVGGLHGLCLKTMKREGAELVTRARVSDLRRDGEDWVITTTAGEFRAGTVVNAAGAWADPIAEMAGAQPMGVVPYRRTVVQLRVDPPVKEGVPHVSDFDGEFYFKPEAGGKLWLCPQDETPVAAQDIAPEELDVAIAIDRLENAVEWRIAAIEHRWAGLRSFTADRLPVIGFATDVPNYFFFVGQGGFGIQTAPAAAAVAGAVLLGRPLPDFVAHIDPVPFGPRRITG